MDYTTITTFDNMYSKLKPKQQAYIRERDYTNIICNLLLPMVNFNGFPDSVSLKNLNLYRMLNGDFAIQEYKGELKAFYSSPVGLLDTDGEPIKVKNASAFAPVILDGVNGVNCVVGHNNSMRTPDYNIFRFAHMFAQTDLSMVYNLFYARLNKVFATDDEETTKILQGILDGMEYGKLKTITSQNVISELNGHMGKPIQEIKLTDVADIDKLQYLSNFHQDLVKRMCWLYGVPMNNSPKLAQQSTEEIANSNNGSNILLFDIMDNANQFCEKVNKVFGLNTSATLGDAWEQVIRSQGLKTDADGVVFQDPQAQENTQTEKGGNDEEN